MNTKHPIWTGRLRALEPSAAELPASGGGEAAPVVAPVKHLSIGAEVLKRGADRAAERAKNAPGAGVDDEDDAAGDGRAPASGADAGGEAGGDASGEGGAS